MPSEGRKESWRHFILEERAESTGFSLSLAPELMSLTSTGTDRDMTSGRLADYDPLKSTDTKGNDGSGTPTDHQSSRL
jgi:hypothetical protein